MKHYSYFWGPSLAFHTGWPSLYSFVHTNISCFQILPYQVDHFPMLKTKQGKECGSRRARSTPLSSSELVYRYVLYCLQNSNLPRASTPVQPCPRKKNSGKLRIALLSRSWIICQALLDPAKIASISMRWTITPEPRSQLWSARCWGRSPGFAGARVIRQKFDS